MLSSATGPCHSVVALTATMTAATLTDHSGLLEHHMLPAGHPIVDLFVLGLCCLLAH